jgi:hypothetical protein
LEKTYEFRFEFGIVIEVRNGPDSQNKPPKSDSQEVRCADC